MSWVREISVHDEVLYSSVYPMIYWFLYVVKFFRKVRLVAYSLTYSELVVAVVFTNLLDAVHILKGIT